RLTRSHLRSARPHRSVRLRRPARTKSTSRVSHDCLAAPRALSAGYDGQQVTARADSERAAAGEIACYPAPPMRAGWLAIGLVATGLCACPARAGDLAGVERRGELTWGGDLQGGAPYVFETRSGEIQGFEVDIADAIARRLGVRARFVQNDWSTLIPARERGDFDLALNGIEDTQGRRARVQLSIPYFVYGETLAVRRGAPYASLADLSGKRVATLNPPVAHDVLAGHPVELVLYE